MPRPPVYSYDLFCQTVNRCLYGYVVDMFEVQFMHFAIFNVADIFVVVGGILFCIYYLFLHDKQKENGNDHPL